MSSSAHDVALFLAANAIGTFAGDTNFSIHVGAEPAAPNNVITIYDTPGLEPDTDELDLLRPSFQVRVRVLSYLEGQAKQEAIRDLLILPFGLTMNGTEYINIVQTSDIASIGRDDEGRHVFVSNYRAIKER
jgi:hypothetical protein